MAQPAWTGRMKHTMVEVPSNIQQLVIRQTIADLRIESVARRFSRPNPRHDTLSCS